MCGLALCYDDDDDDGDGAGDDAGDGDGDDDDDGGGEQQSQQKIDFAKIVFYVFGTFITQSCGHQSKWRATASGAPSRAPGRHSFSNKISSTKIFNRAEL